MSGKRILRGYRKGGGGFVALKKRGTKNREESGVMPLALKNFGTKKRGINGRETLIRKGLGDVGANEFWH